MPLRTWEEEKSQFCSRAGCEVSLEVEVVYPPEYLPEQPARLISHRCSHAADCIMEKTGGCVWTGGNPDYDPFSV